MISLSLFLHAYRELSRTLAERPISHGDIEEDAIAHDLLQRYGLVRLIALLSRYYQGSHKNYRGTEYSLRTFQAAIKGLLVQETKERVLSSRDTGR